MKAFGLVRTTTKLISQSKSISIRSHSSTKSLLNQPQQKTSISNFKTTKFDSKKLLAISQLRNFAATVDQDSDEDFKPKKKEAQPPVSPDKVTKFIEEQVKANPVVIFMKGIPEQPRCGFSGLAIQILKSVGVTNIKGFDVLSDPDLREGVKKYTNWPTIPQVFIAGEFIGGSDILRDMYTSRELDQKLKDAGIPLTPPPEAEEK